MLTYIKLQCDKQLILNVNGEHQKTIPNVFELF